MKIKLLSAILIASFFAMTSCSQKKQAEEKKEPANWAERLGYPAGKKVIMLHIDDAGMCEEANIATKKYLLAGHVQAAAVMMPCPEAEDMILWAKEHPNMDVGLHLTHTSEWKNYRWPSVSPVDEVPSLIDEEGNLWHEVPQVVQHATVEDVEKEIRAQIEKSIALGYRPDHIDTHMGTLYGHPEFAKAFLKVAMEYNIPANAIEMSDTLIVESFKKAGYPITDEMIAYLDAYTLPKIDNFVPAPNADTYKAKVEAFKGLIKSLRPGLTGIFFHPSVETEQLKGITNLWKQRVWEAEMFADPDLIQFFEDEGIVFTNWKEIMKRFNEGKS
jgi:predicted glycoside hydrolase/deacetylase ChbG (UPF0249 family)